MPFFNQKIEKMPIYWLFFAGVSLFKDKNGPGDGTRTRSSLLGRQVLIQLSFTWLWTPRQDSNLHVPGLQPGAYSFSHAVIVTYSSCTVNFVHFYINVTERESCYFLATTSTNRFVLFHILVLK